MARGTTLLELREMLRAEIGASSNVGMGVNTIDQYDHLLRRTQQRLWADHDWDFAYIERDTNLVASQRYYSFGVDIDPDNISSAHIKYGDIWHNLEYGIGPQQYNFQDSDIAGNKSEPVVRWRHYENDQFEVWPVPSSAGQKVRFKAIKKLSNLNLPTDTAELDDNLIVLFSAAEVLARTKAADAQAKLAQATTHYARMKGKGVKYDRFIYGGGLDRGERLRIIGGRYTRDDRS
jgi:hypothetical protein